MNNFITVKLFFISLMAWRAIFALLIAFEICLARVSLESNDDPQSINQETDVDHVKSRTEVNAGHEDIFTLIKRPRDKW